MAPVVRLPFQPPQSPMGRASLCTLAVALVSLAVSNVVYGMSGGSMTAERVAWTFVALGLGFFIIWAFHCHAMLSETPPPKQEAP